MKHQQRGVALITAVLIVAIVAAVAMSLAMAQQVWLRQTQNLIDLSRAEQLRQGAFEFAAAVVAEDAKRGQTDHVNELHWTTPVTLPTEGGAVLIKITDAQSRFNLNNLAQPATPAGQAPPATAGNAAATFRQLLLSLKVEPTAADALVAALKDWVDENANAEAGGAEDIDYLNHDPPYRAANRMLASVEELRLIKGYDEKLIRALRPHVIALPRNDIPINVNTARAMMLAAVTGMDPSTASSYEVNENRAPYKDDNEFKQTTNRQNLNGIAVSTGYFIVSVEARIGRVRRLSEAIIERPPNGTNTRVRWYWQPAFEIVDEENDDDEAKS